MRCTIGNRHECRRKAELTSRRWLPLALLQFAAFVAGCSDPVSRAIQDLQHDDASVRAAAARTLAELRTSDRRAVAALVAVADDEHADVRRLACFALGVVSPPDENAASAALRVALDDPDAKVQRTAMHALARVAPADQATVDALVRAARENDLRAIVALGRLGSTSKQAVGPLMEIANTRNLLVRVKAIEALGQIGPDAAKAIPLLQSALRATDPEVRRVTREALRSIRATETR